MNEMTLFLAQIFGPVLGLVGLGILINQDFYSKAFKDFNKEGFSFVAIVMSMIAVGVVLVLKHFLWGSLSEVLVSLIGLGFLVKGAMLALMPKAFNGIVNRVYSKGLLKFAGLLWLVGGGYLSWVGFLT